MYGLYWWRTTGAFAPEAVLREIGAAFERIPVDTAAGKHREAWYRAVNPRGQVPALRLPDGSVMTESAAMVLHLCDAHPEADLLPPQGSPERAQALRWLLFCVANLYEADLRWEDSARYTSDQAAAPGIRKQAAADLTRHWAMMEQASDAGGPWFFGRGFSALDLYVAMLAGWHFEPRRLFADCPRVARITRAVSLRPAVAPIWRDHYGHKDLFPEASALS